MCAGVPRGARVCASVSGYVCVCAGMQGCVWVCAGVRNAGRCVYVGVHKCELAFRVCGWDEFSEYLLENRIPTSADFNTYPIRIF